MSGWVRARGRQRCGSCGEPIPVGAPLRRLSSGLIRCARCAQQWLGEEVPATLAEAVPAPRPAPADLNGHATEGQRLIALWRERLGLDWKARAAGDES